MSTACRASVVILSGVGKSTAVARIETTPPSERKDRQGEVLEINGLFGTALVIAGGSVSAAGRPRLLIRLMAFLPYLKHAFYLSDEELVIRWSENVVWQYFSGQEYYHRSCPAMRAQIALKQIYAKEKTQDAALQGRRLCPRQAPCGRSNVNWRRQRRPNDSVSNTL